MTPDRVTRRPAGEPARESLASGGCLVSYRALAALAENTREGQASHAEIQATEAILAKLRAGKLARRLAGVPSIIGNALSCREGACRCPPSRRNRPD
jgi:hypothetical protein